MTTPTPTDPTDDRATPHEFVPCTGACRVGCLGGHPEWEMDEHRKQCHRQHCGGFIGDAIHRPAERQTAGETHVEVERLRAEVEGLRAERLEALRLMYTRTLDTQTLGEGVQSLLDSVCSSIARADKAEAQLAVYSAEGYGTVLVNSCSACDLRFPQWSTDSRMKCPVCQLAAVQGELADAEKSRGMHADLNRRVAKALGKPFEGAGSSWHDLPEGVASLQADKAAALVVIEYERGCLDYRTAKGLHRAGEGSTIPRREAEAGAVSSVLRIVIPGIPHGQGRPRACVRGAHASVYERGEDKSWKAYASGLYLQAIRASEWEAHPFGGPMSVSITAFWPCPKSAKKADRSRLRWRAGKPDADNIAKAVCDAANGVLWIDDAQVSVLLVRRMFAREGEAPRVEVEVSALEGDPVQIGPA